MSIQWPPFPTLGISPNSSPPTTPSIFSNKPDRWVQIRLKDGYFYVVDDCNIVDPIHNTDCLEIECTKEVFELGYWIAQGKAFGNEDPFSEELWKNPYVYEEMEGFFKALFPSSSNEHLNTFRNDHLRYSISPANAKILLEKYTQQESEDKVRLMMHLSNALQSFPVAVQESCQVLRIGLYVCAEEEKYYYKTLNEYQSQIINWSRDIKNNEESPLNRGVDNCLDGENSLLNIFIVETKFQRKIFLKRYQEKIVPYRNEEYKNSDCPFLQFLAAQSREAFQRYQEFILKCLTVSCADITRRDLIEYLIGPKAYLFDYYNIRLKEENGYELVYIHPETNNEYAVHYALENISPSDLEQEIRADCRNAYKKNQKRHFFVSEVPDFSICSSINLRLDQFLPPPLNLSSAPSVPFSDELGNLQLFVESIKTWSNLSEQDQQNIIEAVFIYNRWNDYKLENLSLSAFIPNVQSVSGNFEVKIHDGNLLYPFRLSYYDFRLIVEDPEYLKHNSQTTRAWLDKHFSKKIY